MNNKIKTLMFVFTIIAQIGFTQQNSENGYSINPTSQWRILVIWAEVTTGGFTTPSSVANYGKGALPSDANDFFDLAYTPGVEPTAYLSKYFYQMSFGKHVILCDHLDHTIQMSSTDPNLGTGLFSGYKNLYTYLNALYNQNPSQFSTNHLVGHSPLSDFDKHTILPTFAGAAKPTVANGLFDGIIILWKNNPNYPGGGAAFVPQAGNGSYPILGFSGVENDAAFTGSGGEGTKKFIIQEYFHGLYGGNEYHTGAGAGTHTFMNITNPWGISAQLAGAGISQAANGWDRHRLGWYGWKDINQTTYKTNLISALDQSNNEVNTDFTINSNLGTGLFVLRDHVKYGDAIRIKLPHLQDDPAYPICKNQYLWVENHQKLSTFDYGQWESGSPCKEPTKPGMWAFIQVGKDDKLNNLYYASASLPNAFASFIFPLTANGNHDFTYSNPHNPGGATDCNWGNNTVDINRADPNVKQNPLTGYNTLFNYWNSNGDNKLASSLGDIYQPGLSEVVGGTTIYNGHYHGDGLCSYNFATGKTKISKSTNPSTTPVYTYASALNGYQSSATQHLQSYENRTIWLNGISIELLQENYQPLTYGTGAILVKVRFDEYDVTNNVRWCGLIKLSPNDFNSINPALNLTTGNSILIDRGKSYTKHYSVDQDPSSNEYRFSELSEFTVLPNAYFYMAQNTNVTVDGNSTMRIKSGGKLEVDQYSNVIIKKGSTLILEAGAQLIVRDNAYVKIEQGGTLMYNNSTINLSGNNAFVEFEGNLNIANNADFTFTGAGYVKFSQQGWINSGTNPSNIIAGTGSKITLIGLHNNDKVLEVTQESMYAFFPLTKFTLKNGKAELGDGSRICADRDVLLQGARITSKPGSQNNHRGFNTYGQSNITATTCIFENGSYGFYAINSYGGAPITFFNCQFKSCSVAGLTTVDKGATVNNCSFSNNLDGWVAQGMTFPCSGNNTSALNNTNNGINFTSTSTSGLFLEKPSIKNNLFTGIYHEGASMLTTHCATITSNGNFSNQYGYGVDITNNAIYNNSPNVAPFGGLSNVSSNFIGVQASCANAWYNDGGRNNYQSVFKVANGTFNTSCNNPILSALNNKWKTSNTASPIDGIDYKLRTCNCGQANNFTHIIIDDSSPMVNLNCGTIPPHDPNQIIALQHSNPIEFCPTCEKITTSDFNNVRLNVAVKTALSYIEIADSTKNDVKAIDLFSQILTYKFRRNLPPTTRLGNDEFWLIELSLSKIKEALGNGVKNNKIAPSINSLPVQQVLASIDSLVNIYNFKESEHKALYFFLDKASVYTLVNERKKAIEILDNINGCFTLDPEQITYIKKLRSLIYTEQLVISQQIEKQDFQENYLKVLNGTSQFIQNGMYVNTIVDSTAVPNVKFAGDTVKFYSSDQSMTNNWIFGDCTNINATSPIHVYQKQGVYKVKLTETLKCTSKQSISTLTIIPKPIVSIQQNITSRSCDKIILALKKDVLIDGLPASCYNNGSTQINTNNLRFKFKWDFTTPNRSDFEEIFSYSQVSLNQDSAIHLLMNKGEKNSLKLETDIEINIGGTWKSTGYKIMTIDTLINDSLFQANISISDLLCQMDSVFFKSKIEGGLAPYNISWAFGDGFTSTKNNPIHLFKNSGEYAISLSIKDSLGCKAIINFPPTDEGHPHYVGPPNEDSTEIHTDHYEITIPYCKSINGYAVIQSNCGNNPVSGVSFGLISNNGIIANIEAISDNQGYFEFNPVTLSALDSIKQYSIFTIQPSKYIVLKPYYDVISVLENSSPLTIFLGAAKEDGVVKSNTPEIVTTSMFAIDNLNNKYIAGTINEATTNYYLEKQDSIGNILWVAKYDGYAAGSDSARAVYVDSTSNVYVTGQSWNGTGYDYATIKYDSTGSTQWIARYKDTASVINIATSINQDSLGNIRVSGKNVGQTTVYTTVIYSDCKFLNTINARTKNNSTITNINELQQYYATALSVYPNPNNGSMLNISCTETIDETLKFELYDNTGRCVLTKIFNGKQEQVSINNIVSTGIYFYYIRGTQSGVAYRKDKLMIIKN